MNVCNMNKKKTRRNCAAPLCSSTTTRFPGKYFFVSPPTNSKLRNKWMTALRRKDKFSPKTTFYVCEDHFNLENDLEDYQLFLSTHGEKGRKFKDNVIPRPTTQEQNISHRKNQLHKKQNVASTISNENPDQRYTEAMDIQCEMHMLCDATTQCNLYEENDYINDEVIDTDFSDDFEWIPQYSSSSSSTDSDDEYNLEEEFMKEEKLVKETKNDTIPLYYKSSLREYTGIPQECGEILNILSQVLKVKLRDIYIVLVKIRKNYTFSDIANQFQLTRCTVSSIFSKLLPLLTAGMEKFIDWPDKESTENELPIAFRMNSFNVDLIIDCLEIEIQQPSKALLQSDTYSIYKKGNTLKYLIAVTPSGMITFISIGFGGRTSDIEIVKQSKFIEKLPPEMVVMADRGFKGVATLLENSGHKLLRPPSVASGKKLTTEEVKLTKQIACLRINVERIIRRLREFNILDKHSGVIHVHQKHLDDMITLAASIVNLQPLLVR